MSLLFKSDQLSSIIGPERNLPGINFNIENQLRFIKKFSYTDEFKNFLNKDFILGMVALKVEMQNTCIIL